MATEESVTEQFQFLGIDVENDVLVKCVDLCLEYDIDAESFVEQWVAYSLSHLNGAPPTIKDLDLLERKEFSKRAVDAALIKDNSLQNAGLTIYGAKSTEQPVSDVLSNYMTTTTPKRVKLEKDTNAPSELRPATYSPTINHSDKYTSRSNAGAVVLSYGDENLLQELAKPNDVSNIVNINVTQMPNDDGDIYTKATFGFELLHEKASIYDAHIKYLSECILKKNGFEETTSVRAKIQSEVLVCGRIECDADARLNPKSVVLQGTWEESLGQAVSVDLDNVKQYSLFPGQVVVMRGINPRGDQFIAHEIFSDASRPQPKVNADLNTMFIGKMSIIAVAGPYTTSDNMEYEPLKDLLTYVTSHKPHIVIMTGPFMDCDHAKVKDYSMAETYKSFFDKLVDSLGEVCNACPLTKVYLVSSHKDAFHVNIYPTPPNVSRRKHQNITFLPDPTTLNIGGVVVSVTSTDPLMSLSQEEISRDAGPDKLARLARCPPQQQAPSPHAPPVSDSSLVAAHAALPVTPHLMLLPSTFRYHVKEVQGCMVVNPERLTKGTGGGTFARILLNIDNKTENVTSSIAVQILRI